MGFTGTTGDNSASSSPRCPNAAMAQLQDVSLNPYRLHLKQKIFSVMYGVRTIVSKKLRGTDRFPTAEALKQSIVTVDKIHSIIESYVIAHMPSIEPVLPSSESTSQWTMPDPVQDT